MVKQHMQLDGSFGAPELGPWKQAQTQRYGAAVKRQQLVFKTEPVPWSTFSHMIQGLIKHVLKKLPGPMGVGVAEGGLVRCPADSQMLQLAVTAGQPAANFSQTLGLRQLTKKHSHELIPATEPLGMALSAMLGNQLVKPAPVENGDQLTEKARAAYHGPSSLVFGLMLIVVDQHFPPKEDFFQPRPLFTSILLQPKTCFGQE